MSELDKIKKIMNEQFGIDINAITRDTDFSDDVDMTTLEIAELIMGVESAFNIDIPESVAEKLLTVGDVEEYVKSQKQ